MYENPGGHGSPAPRSRRPWLYVGFTVRVGATEILELGLSNRLN